MKHHKNRSINIYSSKPISEKEIQKRLDLHEDISEVMSNLEEAYQHRGINLKKISEVGFF